MRPLQQFLCGCSIAFGVKTITFIHFGMNCMRMLVAILDIIVKIPVPIVNLDYTLQAEYAIYGMMGIPFVLAGVFGVWQKNEAHVRLYLYYCMVSWVLDILGGLLVVYIYDPCTILPSAMTHRKGGSQICGYVRLLVYGTIFLFGTISLYLIFVVWSYCEMLKIGGTGSGLPDLVAWRKYKEARKGYSSAGIFGAGPPSLTPETPVVYGSMATFTMGGGSKVFSGRYHDTSYPPTKDLR